MHLCSHPGNLQHVYPETTKHTVAAKACVAISKGLTPACTAICRLRFKAPLMYSCSPCQPSNLPVGLPCAELDLPCQLQPSMCLPSHHFCLNSLSMPFFICASEDISQRVQRLHVYKPADRFLEHAGEVREAREADLFPEGLLKGLGLLANLLLMLSACSRREV